MSIGQSWDEDFKDSKKRLDMNQTYTDDYVNRLQKELLQLKRVSEKAQKLIEEEGYDTEGNEHWDALRQALTKLRGEE